MRLLPISLQDAGIGFRYAEQRPIRSNEEIVNEILEANGMLSTQEIKAAIEAQGGGIGINQLEKLLHIRFKRVKEGRKVKWCIG